MTDRNSTAGVFLTTWTIACKYFVEDLPPRGVGLNLHYLLADFQKVEVHCLSSTRIISSMQQNISKL